MLCAIEDFRDFCHSQFSRHCHHSVIPAQAGIQRRILDSRLRGNDGITLKIPVSVNTIAQ